MLRRLFTLLANRPVPHTREPRHDPELGMIAPAAGGTEWHVRVPDFEVTISVRGVAEPDPGALAHARAIVAEFPQFRERVAEFLREQARTTTPWASEIGRLELETVYLLATDAGMLYFRGPEAGREWRCDYADGVPADLGFDD